MPFGLKNARATYQWLVNKMFIQQIRWNVEVYVDDIFVKTKKEDHHLNDLKETFKTLRLYGMKLNPSKCVFRVSSGKFPGFMVSQWGVEVNPDKMRAILEISPLKNVKEVHSQNGRVATLNKFVLRVTDKCLPFLKILKKAFEWTDECQSAFKELKAYMASPSLLSPSKPNKELFLYLVVSPTAFNLALIREEDRVQLLVYYTN